MGEKRAATELTGSSQPARAALLRIGCGQPEEDGRGSIQRSQLLDVQRSEPFCQERVAAGPALVQDSFSRRGEVDPNQPTIARVCFLGNQAVIEKRGGKDGNAGSRHALRVCQLAERERPVRIERPQCSNHRHRVLAIGFLSEAANGSHESYTKVSCDLSGTYRWGAKLVSHTN